MFLTTQNAIKRYQKYKSKPDLTKEAVGNLVTNIWLTESPKLDDTHCHLISRHQPTNNSIVTNTK